jgi:hypothetical protein
MAGIAASTSALTGSVTALTDEGECTSTLWGRLNIFMSFCEKRLRVAGLLTGMR